MHSLTLANVRIPRIISAVLVGASLPLAGLIFQVFFSNPLATLDTLGPASGSSFGAALAILLGFNVFGIEATAFAFGLLTIIMSYPTNPLKMKQNMGNDGYIVLMNIKNKYGK